METESKRMYSWWWASHISPRNSKWLQENLTDMDSKVKLMIKLIEVDEDTFARRAEMYYKKRPELVRLVEELYRAYRALAERYDHATVVIRHAHKSISAAFPNQVHFLDSDDGSFGPSIEASFGDQDLSQSERLKKSEMDIKDLKEAIVKLEAEKEVGLLWYQESMKRLSNLESGFHQKIERKAHIAELKKSLAAEFEIFILQQTLQGMRRTNCSLLKKCEKLLEMSNSSDILITKLENENAEKKEEVRLLSDQVMGLRLGMFELMKVLETDLDHVLEENPNEDQTVLHTVLLKVDDTRQSLFRAWDENQKLVIEKSVLEEFLASEIGCLREKLQEIEFENSCIAVELSTFDTLSLIYKSGILERSDVINRQLECEFSDAKIMLSKKEMELSEARKTIETLRSDLKMEKDKAGATFVDLQKSSVLEVLYKEKLLELSAEHQCLVDKSNLDGLELVQLKEKNSQAEARWTEYVSAMETIRNAVASLERHVGDKDVTTTKTSVGFFDLHEIALRIKALEDKVKGKKSFVEDDQMPVEKELRVDSLELSKRYIELGDSESNKKILERLSLEYQKLKGLGITVQDLKQKVGADVKEKLKETESAIAKLMDDKGKIVKNIQDYCSNESSCGDYPSEIEASEEKMRKVLDRAKRWFEKAKRLEMEVEKIQFAVVKIDESNKIMECGRKVVLSDYLYGSGIHTRRRRMARFCACVEPKTSGDE